MSQLNSEFTFDTFVAEKDNQLAYEAALTVAKSPGQIYNPLFIYGHLGVGKTHLMQAIAHSISIHHPELKLLYIDSQEFENSLIDAIHNENNFSVESFRAEYCCLDVLLIDSFSFLTGNESAIDEFFYIFDALYHAQKQLVISLDFLPYPIESIDPRFLSYFRLGRFVGLDSPGYEDRIKIVQNQAEAANLPLSDEVIQYIASNITCAHLLSFAISHFNLYCAVRKTSEITLDIAEKELSTLISAAEAQASRFYSLWRDEENENE